MSLLHRARFFMRKLSLGFTPTELVLDIGSGNDPHPRADLLCDKFVLDDAEREAGLVADRPLVGGELEHLPFKDGSIDFAIASHVLEHVADPHQAVAELRRVAKRGYIETPAEFGGKLMDLPGHRWYVRLDGNTLVFTGKLRGMYDPQLNGPCFQLWAERDESYMNFFRAHPELFFVQHRWNGELSCQVIEPEGTLFEPEDFFHANVSEAVMEKAEARTPKERLKNLIRDTYHSRLYGPERKVALEHLCACPACGGSLSFAEQAITCTSCARSYPYAERGATRVPMLIQAYAR